MHSENILSRSSNFAVARVSMATRKRCYSQNMRVATFSGGRVKVFYAIHSTPYYIGFGRQAAPIKWASPVLRARHTDKNKTWVAPRSYTRGWLWGVGGWRVTELPPSLYVYKHIKPKYASTHCNTKDVVRCHIMAFLHHNLCIVGVHTK